MTVTRRELGAWALGSLATGLAELAGASRLFAQGRVGRGLAAPRLPLGVAAPGGLAEVGTLDQVIARVRALGLDMVELESDIAETAAGLDDALQAAAAARGRAAAAAPAATTPSAGRAQQTPEQAAAAAERARLATIRTWRGTVAMSTFVDLRQRFAQAGVAVPLLKMKGLGPSMNDDEVDYAFRIGKALGCRAVTCEAPVSSAKRLGAFADRHAMRVAYRSSRDVKAADAFVRPGAWEQAFFYTRRNTVSLDIGDFTAGNSRSPLAFLREHGTRVAAIHLRDRRIDNGPSVPWGEGDSDVREVLQFVRQARLDVPLLIDCDYPVPAGSTRAAEIARCVAFCRDALR